MHHHTRILGGKTIDGTPHNKINSTKTTESRHEKDKIKRGKKTHISSSNFPKTRWVKVPFNKPFRSKIKWEKSFKVNTPLTAQLKVFHWKKWERKGREKKKKKTQ